MQSAIPALRTKDVLASWHLAETTLLAELETGTHLLGHREPLFWPKEI
jgi:hypothetical protein